MPDTTPIPPTTPYVCRRCGVWTTLEMPCPCPWPARLDATDSPLDLPSFLAGGLVFTALFGLIKLACWLVG